MALTHAEARRCRAALVAALRRLFGTVSTRGEDLELAAANVELFPSTEAQRLLATVTAEYVTKGALAR
jgi:hypothetical protein